MDRRLRRAPDAEWVLMYRLGLSRKRIAALVQPAAVGYHLVIARRQDPGLEAEHQAAAGAVPVSYPSPADLAHMEEVIAWVSAEGRLPEGRSAVRSERSMARWLSGRRREAAEGNKILKRALVLSAFAVLMDPSSRAHYDRKRHNQALIALARRRCGTVYAMLSDGTPYTNHG